MFAVNYCSARKKVVCQHHNWHPISFQVKIPQAMFVLGKYYSIGMDIGNRRIFGTEFSMRYLIE